MANGKSSAIGQPVTYAEAEAILQNLAKVFVENTSLLPEVSALLRSATKAYPTP